MSEFTPTEEQLREVFDNSMLYEILFTFGVPSHHPADYAQWEFINYTRLAHARVLYGFLQTPRSKRRDDDVLAEDFGFACQPDILLGSDRERLNKDLFHFTYRRLRHTPATQTKPWPPTILANLHEPTLKFMRFIRDERADIFKSPHKSEMWSELIKVMESGRELQLYAFSLTNALSFVFSMGEELPGGKPALTRHFEVSFRG